MASYFKKVRFRFTDIFILLLSAILFVGLFSDLFSYLNTPVYVIFIGCFVLEAILFVAALFRNKINSVNISYFLFFIWTVLEFFAFFVGVISSSTKFVIFGLTLKGECFFYILNIILVSTFSIFLKLSKSSIENRSKFIYTVFALFLIINFIFLFRGLSYTPDAAKARSTTETFYGASVLLGVPTYSMIHSLAIISPAIFEISTKRNGWKKYFWIALGFITLYAIFKSEFATAAIIAIVEFFLWLSFKLNNIARWIVVTILAGIIIVFLFTNIGYNVLISLASKFSNDSAWHKKIVDIANSFLDNEATGQVNDRTARYMLSFQSFLSSPILGGLVKSGIVIGGHSTLLDMLAETGLVGTTIFIASVVTQFVSIVKSKEFKNCKGFVISVFVGFLLILILKNSKTSYCIYLSYYFLLPLFVSTFSRNKIN